MRAFERQGDRPPWQYFVFVVLGLLCSWGFLRTATAKPGWAVAGAISWSALAICYHYIGLRTAWNGHLAIAAAFAVLFLPCFAVSLPFLALFGDAIDGPLSAFAEYGMVLGLAGGLASAFSFPIALATLAFYVEPSEDDG